MIKTKLFEKRRSTEKSMQPAHSLYITAAWEQHAHLLCQLCEYSQNIILITAPLNGGKSAFLNYLMQTPTNTIRKETIKVSKQDTIEGFIAKIGLVFGVEFKENEPWHKSIRHTLDTLSQTHRCALIIDDAHHLSTEQLKVLLELSNQEENNALCVVLFAEPSLEFRLFSPDFNALVQGRIYTIELEAWSLNETKRYIVEFGNAHLNPEQIKQIFEQTQGLPGQVIQELEKLKQQTIQPTGAKMTKSKNWRIHPISLGVLVGVIAGGSYLMLNSKLEEENATPPTNSAKAEKAWQTNEIAQKTDEVQFHFDKVDKSDPVDTESPLVQEELIVAPTEVKTTAEMAVPKTEEVVALNATPQAQPSVQTPAQAPVSSDVVIVTKKPETPVPHVEAPQAKANVTKTTVAHQFSPEEKYLLSVAKDRYTIQLIGASKEDSIKKFILQNAIADKTYRFRTKRANRDWFVVVYGDFASKEEAKAALLNMPAELKKANLQPWVRDFNGIHTDIEKVKG